MLPKTRVWGSKPENLHSSSAIGPLKIELRWECEESSREKASGSGVTFKYNPFGQRVYKQSPNATSIFVYDGDNLTETVNSSGGTVARYAEGQHDEPLAMQRGTSTDYDEADGLESITSLTASNGSIAQSYTYDSFGNTTNSNGSLTNFFRYTGREFDTETNLYYYRARYYDPQVGRFLTEDPLGPSEEGPNLYAYVSNNPIMNVDPWGLYTIDKSCKGTQCQMNGGGPNNPNQHPTSQNVEQVIQQEADESCGSLNSITDPTLRSCIARRCKSGKIKCSNDCPPGFAGESPYNGVTATMCVNHWPDWTTPAWVGQAIIHEWAHSCGWHHGDGKGVPLDPGRDHP
jgi:RHS repeat-associated protein